MTAFVENLLKFFSESIDPNAFFAYNISMSVTKGKKKTRLALQILLTAACALWLAFIFSNSLRTGTASSSQSSRAVRLIQRVVGWFFPNSWVVNATGEEYLRLHNFVRKLAHFTEFALLGALSLWCYAAYTVRIKWSFIPAAVTLLAPVCDEGLQLFVSGRAASITDVFIDMAGGATGLLCAALVLLIIAKIRSAYGRKKLRNRPDQIQ